MILGLVHWNKINKGKIKVIVTPCVRVLQIDIGCKHAIFMCYENIAKSFENLSMWNHPIRVL